MFVVSKSYQGREFCRVESTNHVHVMKAMKRFMIDCVMNPKFSFSFHIEPLSVSPDTSIRQLTPGQPLLLN